MTSRTGSNKRGLTLIEVLVSIVILSTATVGVTQAMARIAYAQEITDQQAQVLAFSVSKLAELELDVLQGDLEDSESGSHRVGAHTYDWEAVVATDELEPRLKTLTLDVRWRYRAYDYEERFATRLRLPPVEPS